MNNIELIQQAIKMIVSCNMEGWTKQHDDVIVPILLTALRDYENITNQK